MTITSRLPLALVCLLSAPCALAQASDLNLRPSLDWTQMHIGVGVGYGSGTGDFHASDGDAALSINGLGSSGWLASVEAGYDYQFDDSIVVGLQGDYTGSDISSRLSISDSSGSLSAKAQLEGTASALVRAGLLLDNNTLFYGLGGYTHSWWKAASEKRNRGGWTVGAGVERLIASDISVKLEYRYTRSSAIDLLGASAGTSADITPTTQTVRAVVSYRF